MTTVLQGVLDAAPASWRRAFDEGIAAAPSPEQAAGTFERLAESAGGETVLAWPEENLGELAILLGGSTYFARLLVARGAEWPELATRYRLGPPSRDELIGQCALAEDADVATLHRSLRRLAAAEMFRIGARDLLGIASLDETVTALTLLADVSIGIALDHSRRMLAKQHGDATGADGKPIGFVVLGMGKLGGGELNYSSDVDLVYMYDTDEIGEGSPNAREFFTNLASAVTRAVGDVTSDGVVFRVDLRLRPEGVNGLPVNSVGVALDYYEGWGDTWERGALAKARPVAGDIALGGRFLKALEPFIYRRHLDYDTVEDLRGMKDRIDAELALLKPGTRNVKIGRGGIRELEFVVQMLQLIHGGHVLAVRGASTRRGIDALEAEHLLSSAEAKDMHESYLFLRNVEHAVQVEEKRQTQALPQRPEELRTLARRLGYGTGRRGAPDSPDEVSAFEHDWDRHTHRVHELFVRFLELRPGESRPEHAGDPMAIAVLGQIGEGRVEDAGVLLERMGIPGGAEAARNLARIYQGRLRGPASPQRRRAVEALAPRLLDAVARSSDPSRALAGLVEFLIRTGAHTSYLALLGDSPKTMEILVSLFASSPYLAGHLAGHPELLDSLVRIDSVRKPEPTAEELRETLDAAMPDDPTDEEEIIAALRRFRVTELLRIGLGDLGGTLSEDGVHRALTTLAEVALVAAVEAARRIVSARLQGPWDRVRLAVIGMGKLGAREMSYGSDLDLIFVYEAGGSDGYDPEAHVVATKWMQKFISLMTARTRDGIVYEVDARLRPSGHSGPLVTSLASFVEYHSGEADLWERQALIRSRVVYADADLAERIEATLAARIWGTSLSEEGAAEIAHLRSRVENELSGEDDGKLNIKTGRGGIVDIEFLVQMLQLRHGAAHPSVRRRATANALEALRDAGVLDSADAGKLLRDYRFLRRLEARLRLERDRPVEELGTDAASVAPLAVRLGYDGDDAGDRLLADYHRTREEVRALYERHFASPAVH